MEDLDRATGVRCKNLQAIVEITFEAEEPRSKSRFRDKNVTLLSCASLLLQQRSSARYLRTPKSLR